MINIKFTDKELKCKYCKTIFIFTKEDQYLYLEKGFVKPARCKECRKIKRKIWKEKLKEKEKNRQKFIISMTETSVAEKKKTQKEV